MKRLADSAKQSEQKSKPRNATKDSPSPKIHRILQLQRILGNRAVAELVQTKRLSPEGRILPVQPKLTVGTPDDQSEQEADHVSKQVMSVPDLAVRHEAFAEGQTSSVGRTPLAATITPFLQHEPTGGDQARNGSLGVDSSVETHLGSSKGLGIRVSRAAIRIQREPAKPSSHARDLEAVGARWIGRIGGTDSAALRSTPSKDPANPHSGTLVDLSRGEFVDVIGRQGGWLKVKALVGGKEIEGYVSHELVDFNRWDLDPDAMETGLTMREALVVLKRAETSKKSDPKYEGTASEKARISAAIATVKRNAKYQVNETTFEVTFAKQRGGKIKVTTIEDFVLFVEAVEAQYPAASAKDVVSEIRQLWYSDENWELLIDSEGIHDGGKQIDIETPPNPLAQMFDMADLAPKAGGKVISTPMGDTDVGHVMAGIDARLSGGPASYPKGRVKQDTAISRFKFENLREADGGDPTAFATFAGDLGQAYASFIFDRYEKMDKNAKLGDYISTFAKPAELTGDIQGYIAASVATDVRSSGNSPTGPTEVKASSIIRDMFLVDKSSMKATTNDYLEKVTGVKGKELNDYIYSTSISFAHLWYAKLVSDNKPELGSPGELFEDYEQEFSERADRHERSAEPDETLAGAVDHLLRTATTKLQ